MACLSSLFRVSRCLLKWLVLGGAGAWLGAAPVQAMTLDVDEYQQLVAFFKPDFHVVTFYNVRPELMASTLSARLCLIYTNSDHPIAKRLPGLFAAEVMPLYYAHEIAHCEIFKRNGVTSRQSELYADLRALEFMHARGKTYADERIGLFITLRKVGQQLDDHLRASVCDVLLLNEKAIDPASFADTEERLVYVRQVQERCSPTAGASGVAELPPNNGVELRQEGPAPITTATDRSPERISLPMDNSAFEEFSGWGPGLD